VGDVAGTRDRTAALGASVAAAVAWGFAGVLAALTSAPGVVLTFYRMAIGAALLLVVVRLAGRRVTAAVLRASIPGGLLLAADMALFFSAVKLTSVAVATVIGALQPALVLLVAGPFLGERITRAKVAWTAVAIGGVAVIVVGGGAPGHDALAGDLLAIGSLVAWSGYFVASKWARDHRGVDALEYTAGVTVVGAVVMLPTVYVVGDTLGQVHAGDWLWIVLLAVIPGTAHVLMNWAHRHLDVSVSSVVVSTNPIVAAVAAYFILGQTLVGLQIAGGMVGIVAVAIVATLAQPASGIDELA
jgi:drug/metabolite transporter (DMT)-like permease